MTPLSGWQNFYVIVGSSAGALIGLQFVAMTLMADAPVARRQGAATAAAAFGTPTIVHFSCALLLSAILNAPWHGVEGAGVAWGLLGAVGIVYEIIVVRRMRSQDLYRPEFEDWLFHVLLPLLAYGVMAGSACAVRSDMRAALFCVAGSALLLLFIGIHNAWDAVTYHVYVIRQRPRGPEKQPAGDAEAQSFGNRE